MNHYENDQVTRIKDRKAARVIRFQSSSWVAERKSDTICGFRSLAPASVHRMTITRGNIQRFRLSEEKNTYEENQFCISAMHSSARCPNGASTECFQTGPNQVGSVSAIHECGSSFAVLEGDPTANSGDFTVRIKMPDSYRIAPHWHPNARTSLCCEEPLRLGWATHLIPARWEIFQQEASLTWIQKCIIMQWHQARQLFRSTANRQ
jgi:hypothetical protein